MQARNARRVRSAQAKTNNELNARSGRRMMEDNLAKVFGFIVGVFMVCHMPRLLLGIHEAWITPSVVACNAANRRAFPMWAEMFGHISHVMMAINSSVNGIIYGFISPQFRKSLKKIAIRWGCMKKPPNTPVPMLVFPTGNKRTSRHQAVQTGGDQDQDDQGSEIPRFITGSVSTLIFQHDKMHTEASADKECDSLPMIIVHQESETRLSTWPRVTRV